MIFAKKVPDDTYPNKALHHQATCLGNAPLLQTEKPVAFKNHFFCTPGVGTSGYSIWVGVADVHLLLLSQINLEPHHSLVKELLVVSLQRRRNSAERG